jgi:hypothetical protein
VKQRGGSSQIKPSPTLRTENFIFFDRLTLLTLLKYSLLNALILCSLFSCTKDKQQTGLVYENRDYRQVKLYLDTLNATLQADLDSTGTYTIPYTHLTRGTSF